MDGEGLRALRRTLRMSQSDLRAALNSRLGRSYDKPRISRWENGREPIPEDVAATAEALASGQPQDARILVLANQKGGVGKTTSALNLACAMAQSGLRVLLIDNDPQASATTALLAAGAHAATFQQGKTMASVILQDRPLEDIIIRAGSDPGFRGAFDLAPSHITLAEADTRREAGFDVALREAIDPVRTRYDFIVIDAPPNLGALTIMALTTAQDVIVPVRTEPYDTMGVGLILGTINKVQRRLNSSLRLAGILPTQYTRKKWVDQEVIAHLITAMADKAPVLAPIPAGAAFGQAARSGRTAIDYAPSSPGALAYRKLADSIISGTPLPKSDVPDVSALVSEEAQAL